jgi:hypothetical protein
LKNHFIPICPINDSDGVNVWTNPPPSQVEIALIFHNGMIFENVYARQVFIESISHWILQSDYDKLKKESP